MMTNARIRTDKNFVRKAQSFCKVLRSEICNVTLQEMSDLYNVNLKNLSAWENGRSNKAEYIFYYYDLCNNEIDKQTFLKVVFESDNKDVIIDTTKDITGRCSSYTIHLKDRN